MRRAVPWHVSMLYKLRRSKPERADLRERRKIVRVGCTIKVEHQIARLLRGHSAGGFGIGDRISSPMVKFPIAHRWGRATRKRK